MFATVVNMIAILAGAILGMVLKKGIPDKAKDTIMQGMGIAVIVIGLRMALVAENDVIVILSLVLGALIGEVCSLDRRMNDAAEGLKKKLKVNDERFVEGFVSASLIFCVGAMAIVGSIEAGLNNDYTVLFVKSTLDGIMAVVLASSLGIGVAYSALAVLVYQGAITLLAQSLEHILIEQVISYMTAAGGVLIIGIGLSVSKIKEMNTMNLLPSILVAAVIAGVMTIM